MPVLAPLPSAPPAGAPSGPNRFPRDPSEPADPLDVVRRRAALWSGLDHRARLVAEIERRARVVGAGFSDAGSADAGAPRVPVHARLTSSADPLDELVAIDAAVVAAALAIEDHRARLEENRHLRHEWRRRALIRTRAVLAAVALVVGLIAASLL